MAQVLISNYRVEFTGRHEHADDFTWWVPLRKTPVPSHGCPDPEVPQNKIKLDARICRMDEAYFFEDWREAAGAAGATL